MSQGDLKYLGSYSECIYKTRKKVIGEFVCDKIVKYDYQVIACAKYEVNGAYVKEELRYNAGACLTSEEMFFYSKGKPLYGWHISELKIYEKPKELREFFTPMGKRPSYMIERPPMSWQYLEEI